MISLNRMTVQRWVADVSKGDKIQFSKIFNNCLLFSLLMSQWTSPQLHKCVYLHVELFEKVVHHHSMQSQTKESDFIQALQTVKIIIWNYLSLWA
jgi:hypothetical protein